MNSELRTKRIIRVIIPVIIIVFLVCPWSKADARKSPRYTGFSDAEIHNLISLAMRNRVTFKKFLGTYNSLSRLSDDPESRIDGPVVWRALDCIRTLFKNAVDRKEKLLLIRLYRLTKKLKGRSLNTLLNDKRLVFLQEQFRTPYMPVHTPEERFEIKENAAK